MNIHVIRCEDPDKLRKIYALDGIWEDMTEDNTVDDVAVNPAVWHMPFLVDGELAGIATAHWMANKLICWHLGMLKKFRGPGSHKITGYILDNFPDVQAMTMIPEWNKASQAHAKKLGFKEIARIENASEKDGKLYSKLILQRDK